MSILDARTELIGTTGLPEQLLARAADVVLLLDVSTGRAVQRWYDPATSKLDLPDELRPRQVVSWIHADDLPGVLEAYASVVHDGGTCATFAHIHPDLAMPADSVMLISLSDVRDIHRDGMLVQVWVIHSDSVVSPDLDASTSLSSLAAAAPIGLQVLSASGRVSFENDRFTDLAVDADDTIQPYIRRSMESGVACTDELVVGERSLLLRVVPTLDDEGRVTLAVASLEDVTRVHDAERRRAQAEEQFDALFHSSPVATALVALDGSLVRANESFAIVTGYPVEQLLQLRFQDITHPDDLEVDEALLAEVLDGTRPNYQMDKRYIHASGHDVWVELTVAPVRGADGAIRNLIAHVEDITSRRTIAELEGADEDLAYWATHDHLTALPNRRYLEHHLDIALRSRTGARRSSDRPVVLFIDLDDFKPVNDSHGHLVGDEVLRSIARRLRNACRDDAVVTRYGGDEFVVVARRLRSVAEVPLLIERIQAAVRGPVSTTVPSVRVGASIGVAIARSGDSASTLLERADRAVYGAKRAGKNTVHVDAASVSSALAEA